MKLKVNLKHLAIPTKIFMTVLIVLIALLILQGIIIQTERLFTQKKQLPAPAEAKAELTEEEKRIERIRRSAKEFLPDGTIHLVHNLGFTPGRRDIPAKEQIYDVNDNLLWEGPSDKRPFEYLSWAEQSRGSYRRVFTKQRMKEIQMITPGFSRFIEIPIGSDDKAEQIWRYYPWGQYFKGYKTNGEKIGYIGSMGFTDSKSQLKPLGKFGFFTAWCPQDSSNPILLWQTQRRIYQIDFEKRNVELIFESADSDISMDSLHGWRDIKPDAEEYVDPEKYRPLLCCVTKDGKRHLILREPRQELSITMPGAWVTATRQDIFVRRYWSDAHPPVNISGSRELYDKWLQEWRGKPRNCWVELYKVNEQGGLDLLNRYDWTLPPPPESVFRARDSRTGVQRYVSQLSPPFYDLVFGFLNIIGFWSSAYYYQHRADFLFELLRLILDFRPLDGITNWILSLIMMIFVFLHGWPRRTSWPKFVFWVVFTGLFNLAGLLAYLALNHTAVIRCPACGRRRGLVRIDCVSCRAELPGPERGKLDLILSI
jgi:hypothetical protein